MRSKTRKIAIMGLLAAVSLVLVFVIRIPFIPGYPHLEYDMADIPILIGAFAYGPVVGLIITVVASVIQGLLLGGPLPWYGVIMHILATGTLVLVASNIYRVKHTKKGAVIGLICGTLAMTGVMLIANHFITPYYLMALIGMGHSDAQVAADISLLVAVLPFNLIKAGVNSVITFLVYKAISKHIKVDAKPVMAPVADQEA